MKLRTELAKVVAALLLEHPIGSAITLDKVGDAIGTRAVSTDEIDAIFKRLESGGRRVVAPPGGNGEANLKRVVEAARSLKQVDPTRRPALSEVASHAKLTSADVLSALYLLRIMQR